MSSKLKRVFSILSNALMVIIIIFAALISIMSLNAKQNDDVPSLFGYYTFSIQTDSMEGTINPGDFIIGEEVEDPYNLREGQIITFVTVNDKGQYYLNTHTIKTVEREGNFVQYETQGDNEEYPDIRRVAPGDVVAVWTGVRIPLLGYVVTFLSGQLGFFLCIVLPVLLYTIWQVYKLVVAISQNQKQKILEEASTQTSDELKQAIINEYLAKQKASEEAKENEKE